jgi:hypothetical protein
MSQFNPQKAGPWPGKPALPAVLGQAAHASGLGAAADNGRRAPRIRPAIRIKRPRFPPSSNSDTLFFSIETAIMKYAFFPYLTTSGRVLIRGIEFRNTKDVEGLALADKDAVQMIGGMFRLHDGTPVPETTFALLNVPEKDKGNAKAMLDALWRVQLILTYLYTKPLDTGGTALTAEHASLFLFTPQENVMLGRVFPGGRDPDGQVLMSGGPALVAPGFHGLRNWLNQFWVVGSSKILPEFPCFQVENPRQNLSIDIHQVSTRDQNWALRGLFFDGAQTSEETDERMFTSLRWYAASCRHEIDPLESIVFLAIALKSLLKVQEGDGGVTARFKAAVLTVLGPVPRLDDWLDQFYKARSKTVHEGRPEFIDYFVKPKKPPKGEVPGIPLRDLRDYGWRIYRMCLNAIVTGAILAKRGRLAELLIHQSERLKSICETVSQGIASPRATLLKAAGLFGDLAEFKQNMLSQHFQRADLDQVSGTIRCVLKCAKAAFSDFEPATSSLIDEIVKAASFDLEQHRRLASLRSSLNAEIDRRTNTSDRDALLGVRTFLEYLDSSEVVMPILARQAK